VNKFFDENYCSFLVYGRLELATWEQLTRNHQIVAFSMDELHPILGCLMLSALHGERVPAQTHTESSILIRAPFHLVGKAVREACFDSHIRNLLPFITDLSREDLLGLATMKTKDPVLLSDLPSFWELFFHPAKGLAKVKTQKALTVLNKESVMKIVCESLLESLDDASQLPEAEMRRGFINERGLVPEKLVKKAMTSHEVLRIIAQRACDLSLKDVNVGKMYIMGAVQLYLVRNFQG